MTSCSMTSFFDANGISSHRWIAELELGQTLSTFVAPFLSFAGVILAGHLIQGNELIINQ